jgi:hypothetical protein
MLSLTDIQGLFIDLRNDNDTLYSESHDPSLQSPALRVSTSAVPTSAPLRRKRGRPKGGAKPVIYGPNPRRGRPPGTGRKQKQSLLGQGGAIGLPVRPRGRPKKQVSPPAVSIEFGKVVSHNVIFALILLTFC